MNDITIYIVDIVILFLEGLTVELIETLSIVFNILYQLVILLPLISLQNRLQLVSSFLLRFFQCTGSRFVGIDFVDCGLL